MQRPNDVLRVRKPLFLDHQLPTADLAMRLLNIRSRQFENFDESTFPPFLAISYAWDGFWDREISFDDINTEVEPTKPGFRPFMAACELALIMDLRYIWCDSFCVDLKSAGDMSEAILHMQSVYRRATICVVFLPGFLSHQSSELSDVPGQQHLKHSPATSSKPTIFQHHSSRELFILSAMAHRLHFCKSIESSERPWINRILGHVVSVIFEISGDDFGRQLADCDAQMWMRREGGSQSDNREARTPILVTYDEPNMPRDLGHALREDSLLGADNTFASTPGFYGCTSAGLGETHFEAFKSAAWEFEYHNQDFIGNGVSGSTLYQRSQEAIAEAYVHAVDSKSQLSQSFLPKEVIAEAYGYAVDSKSQLSDSFLPKAGSARHHTACVESYNPVHQSGVRFPIRTGKQDFNPDLADDWVHVAPEYLSNGSEGPPSTQTISVTDNFENLGGQEDFLITQNNQAFEQSDNRSGFPAAETSASGIIRCWLSGGSMKSTGNAAVLRTMDSGLSMPAEIGSETARRDIRSVSSPGTSSKQRNRVRCFDEWTNSESSLSHGHPLKALVSYIIQEALKRFETWRETKNHSGEISQGNSALLSTSQIGSVDHNLEAGMSTKNNEALEFACPYYKKDPSKYSNCMKRCWLRTIGDVKDHIWQHHRIPFYCPICKKDFSTASSRDQHIVKRTCVLEDYFPFEGVSDDHRRRLFRRRRGVGVKQQWYQIWKILLPQEPPPKSVMLKDEIGQEVAAFREFWSIHGEVLVAEMVQTAMLEAWDKKSEERDLASLFSEVLNGAIDMIFARVRSV